jgi:hypothetical protein
MAFPLGGVLLSPTHPLSRDHTAPTQEYEAFQIFWKALPHRETRTGDGYYIPRIPNRVPELRRISSLEPLRPKVLTQDQYTVQGSECADLRSQISALVNGHGVVEPTFGTTTNHIRLARCQSTTEAVR